MIELRHIYIDGVINVEHNKSVFIHLIFPLQKKVEIGLL